MGQNRLLGQGRPGCCSTAYDEDKERVIRKWNSRVSANSTAPVVIEGPSSTEYEAWLETRPDLTARFETDTFKRTTGYEIWRNAWLRLREMICESRSAAASPDVQANPDDELFDEVQRRMDQVSEAAVEWHQAGREGAEWFDKAETLGAAIESLLELRTPPTPSTDVVSDCDPDLQK